MLPALRLLAAAPHRLLQPTRPTRLLAALLALPLLLGGCGGVGQPPQAVLLEALSLQIQLTQGAIAQALRLDSGGLPEVSRVRVEEQEVLRIGEAKGLRLAGHFDWRLAGDPIRVDSPFELYLQRGERGQSWRLARPLAAPELAAPERADSGPASAAAGSEALGQGLGGAGGEQQWLTYPLALRER